MKVLFRTLILCSAILLSAGEEIIQSTGTLTFRTTAEFHNQWITVTKAPKGNERRFYPAKAPDGTAALCAGRFGKNQMPLARYVFGNGKNGQAALFDVSKAGEENALPRKRIFSFTVNINAPSNVSRFRWMLCPPIRKRYITSVSTPMVTSGIKIISRWNS